MSNRKKRNIVLIIIMSVLTAVAAAVTAYAVSRFLSRPVFDDGVTDGTALENVTEPEGKSFNALIIGVDAGGQNTDTIMLARVDRERDKISLLSIPRDTRVEVNGRKRKINSCYGTGGLKLLFEKVRELTMTDINYYCVIKPNVLKEVVDCLGGVYYEVERDMKYSDPVQDLYIDLEKGYQLLDGDKAEQYCRYRSYVMGDLTRTQAQQRFVKALLSQKLNIGSAAKVKELYGIVSENIVTNVTVGDIVSNAFVFNMLKNDGQIECVEVPGEYNDMEKDGVSYYLIEDESLTELREICAGQFGGSYTSY